MIRKPWQGAAQLQLMLAQRAIYQPFWGDTLPASPFLLKPLKKLTNSIIQIFGLQRLPGAGLRPDREREGVRAAAAAKSHAG